MLLLAPTNSQGFIGAYLNNGAGSLCVHFITPVLAIIDFLLFSEHYRPDEKHVYYSVVPPLVYVGYVIVLGNVFHIRWYKDMLAPYNFLNYGAPTGWFGFDLSLLGSKTLGIGTFYMIVVFINTHLTQFVVTIIVSFLSKNTAKYHLDSYFFSTK